MPLTHANLEVNGKAIALDKFTQSFVAHVIMGMLLALKGPKEDVPEVKRVTLAICEENVDITVNGVEIALNHFVNDFVRDTTMGMISPLRGVESPVKTMELALS